MRVTRELSGGHKVDHKSEYAYCDGGPTTKDVQNYDDGGNVQQAQTPSWNPEIYANISKGIQNAGG